MEKNTTKHARARTSTAANNVTANNVTGTANQEGKTETKKKRVSEEQIRGLVSRILGDADDRQAGALIALVNAIAYEQDKLDRDGMAMIAIDHAYCQTNHFSRVAVAFADKACRNFSQAVQVGQ